MPFLPYLHHNTRRHMMDIIMTEVPAHPIDFANKLRDAIKDKERLQVEKSKAKWPDEELISTAESDFTYYYSSMLCNAVPKCSYYCPLEWPAERLEFYANYLESYAYDLGFDITSLTNHQILMTLREEG